MIRNHSWMLCRMINLFSILCSDQVDYFNNKVICDLVEAQHVGVLAILDEACLNVGKVTDKVGCIHDTDSK